MFEYRTYGALDDRILKDGDVGFVGFNNRLRPDQLQGGMLADAQNVRFDRNGEAQVRKGIEVIEAPFAVGGDVLRLPTTAQIDDGVTALLPTTIESAELVGSANQVSIVINDPAVDPGHTFVATNSVQVEGLGFTTVDPNGTHTLVSVTDNGDTKTLKYALTGGDETYTAAVVLPEQLPFNLNANTTQAIIGFNMVLDQGSVTEVYASTDFSDPNESASQYILIASNLKVVAKNLSTDATVDIAYPTAETVPPDSSMLQAFNKVFIFRKGQVALEWDGSFSTITSGSFEIGKTYTITSLGDNAQSDWNTAAGTSGVTYAVGSTFTAATAGASGTGTATSAFSKVASGTYTQPVTLTATACAVTNNECTITSNTHGLKVGDVIICTKQGSSTLITNQFTQISSLDSFSTLAEEYVISEVPSTTQFKFNVGNSIEDKTLGSSDTFPQFIRRVSVGLGFSHMPAPEFAVYHQRRLVMPFQFSVDASPNSYTSRGIIDEVIASDILDSDTYDQIFGQFRFNAGEADFTVGLHSFSEDNLMVFNRNSIHLINNTTSLQSASSKLLTDEVGCVSRKSIQQVGNQVIFLSDNGVYSTQFFDEYNLRGTETPLSEPINETIKRINKDQRSQAVAVYFDNRYFIAVPLNSEDGTVVATKNNAILIYNFLNKQWESIDSVDSTEWDIQNLIVAGEGTKRGVYAVNQLGGIHKIDARLQGDDLINVIIGGDNDTKVVKGSITTRQYTFGDLSRKTWKEFQMHVESSADNVSNFDISVETENPDSTFKIATLKELNGNADLDIAEDVSIRGRIGNRRGHGIQFTVNNTEGRPRIRSIQVRGSTAFRSTQKAI
jgi:hypothetical protein